LRLETGYKPPAPSLYEENKTMRRTHCGAHIAILTSLLVLSVGCSLEEPSMPSWEVTLRMPLLDETQTMEEIAERNKDFLSVDSLGVIGLSIDTELDRVEIGDHLALDPEGYVFETSIGDLTLRNPAPLSTPDILLVDLLPTEVTSAVGSGFSAEVPPFPFEITRDLPDADNFRRMTLTSGTIRIELRNDLVIPLVDPGREPNALSAILRDDQSGEPVVEVRFSEQIDPGQSAERTVDLSGRTFYGDLSIEIQGNSPGSGDRSVGAEALESSFAVTVSFTDIKVSDAEALIPSQQFEDEDTVVFPDSLRVREASIESGEIVLRVVNDMPIGADLAIQLDEYRDAQGQPLRAEIFIPLKAEESLDIPLDNTTLQVGTLGELRVSWDVTTHDTGDEFVHVRDSDFVRVEIDQSRTVLSRVVGVLDALNVSLEQSMTDVDLPESSINIELAAASMALDVFSGVDVPMGLELLVTGVNQDGEEVELPISVSIPPGDPSTPVKSTIHLDQNNSNILEFLNTMPTEISVSGDAWVGDGVHESVVTKSDFLYAHVTFQAPLTMEIEETTIETEILETGFEDEEVREEIQGNFTSGGISATVRNHLPIGTELRIHIGTDSTAVRTDPDLKLPKDAPLQIRSAAVDPETGLVQNAVTSDQTFSVSEEDIKLLAEYPLYAFASIRIPGTEGRVVKIVATDFIQIIAAVEIGVRVDEGLFEGEEEN